MNSSVADVICVSV